MIRHGQTDWNVEGRYQGQTESHLSALGWAQTESLARALAPARLDAVYSSPLERALRTAEAIAAPHGLPIVTLDGLREIRMGVWEGLTEAEVSVRFSEVFHARRREPERVAPDGGETLAELCARGLRAMSEIVARYPAAAAAAVGHGALNKAILLSVLRAPLGSYWRIRQDNGAINIIDFNGSRAQVTLLNETSHLDGLPRSM